MKILAKTLALIGCTLATGLGNLTADEFAGVKPEEVAKMMTKMSGTIPGQWRVIWTGDTSTEATISWTTIDAGKTHRVHLGTKAGGTDPSKYAKRVDCQVNGNYSIPSKEADSLGSAHYHHCKLEGLQPDTTYYFLLQSDDEFSKPLHFRTAPTSGDFKLIHGGDSRSGISARCEVNLMIKKMVAEIPTIIGFVHGGDFVNNGRSWKEWRMWLSNHELTTGEDGKVLPIIPTRGNHDGGPLIFEIFNLPKDRSDLHYWHATKVTKDVSIVTLDTNYSAKGKQEKWLEKELKENRENSRWLLTNYHRPLFPAVKGTTSHAPVFVPIFEEHNVDLSLESDGHCIKRTVPIRDGKEDPSGVTYVGEGGLGVGQRSPHADRWYLKDGFTSKGHHVMVLEFTESTLNVKTVMLGGKIVDEVDLNARK